MIAILGIVFHDNVPTDSGASHTSCILYYSPANKIDTCILQRLVFSTAVFLAYDNGT